jgi:hypothetical protein
MLADIDSVIPWEGNPRSGDLDVLKASIIKNGFYQPIVVQRSTNIVLAGNHRRQALIELGATQIPVMYVDVDDVQATRLALADNRTSDLAFYNDEALFELLEQLMSADNLDGTGYDRNAYELLLQGVEASEITGGVRQAPTPDDRLDQYNDLDIRSIILPYETSVFEQVTHQMALLRDYLNIDTNAELVRKMLSTACAEIPDDFAAAPEPDGKVVQMHGASAEG